MVSPLKEINCLSREKYKLLKQVVRDLKKKVKKVFSKQKKGGEPHASYHEV
jgi:hypothetical protein